MSDYEQELEQQIEDMHKKLVESERNTFIFRKIAEYVLENGKVIHNIDMDTGKPNGGFFVKSEFNVREGDLQASDAYPDARLFFDKLYKKAEMPAIREDSVQF